MLELIFLDLRQAFDRMGKGGVEHALDRFFVGGKLKRAILKMFDMSLEPCRDEIFHRRFTLLIQFSTTFSY